MAAAISNLAGVMTPELGWAELRRSDPRLQQFEEMVFTETIDARMSAQVRPKTARITIRIHTTRWYEPPIEVSNVKPREEIRNGFHPCNQTRARDYQAEDHRPRHAGDEVIVVNVTSSRIVNWKFPRRDGRTVEASFEANTTNWWNVGYQAQLNSMDQGMLIQWFQPSELFGGDHPPPIRGPNSPNGETATARCRRNHQLQGRRLEHSSTARVLRSSPAERPEWDMEKRVARTINTLRRRRFDANRLPIDKHND
jgi:hypothetical protein